MEDYQFFGNYKIVDPDGQVYLKVVGFPSEVGTESMWVALVSGDENNGVGRLDNEPVGIAGLKLGDLVSFGNGTDTAKPEYLGSKSQFGAFHDLVTGRRDVTPEEIADLFSKSGGEAE